MTSIEQKRGNQPRPVIGSEAALNAFYAGRPVLVDTVRLQSGQIVRRVRLHDLRPTPPPGRAVDYMGHNQQAIAGYLSRYRPDPWYRRLTWKGWTAIAAAAVGILFAVGLLLYWVLASLFAAAAASWPLILLIVVLVLGGGGASCTTIVKITHRH